MEKNFVRGAAIFLILLLVYAAIVAVVPFIHNVVFWISVLFTVLAFLLAGAAAYAGFGKNPGMKSKFYGFPIVRIGAIYLAAQILAGFVFMALGKWVSLWIPFVLYAAALVAAAVGLISADAVVDEINQMDEKLKKDVTLMRGLQSKVLQMKNQCEDLEANRAVSGLAESLRYSDPVSSDAIREAERDLSAAIDELQSAVVDGDNEAVKQLCRKAKGLLDERNRLCKLNK